MGMRNERWGVGKSANNSLSDLRTSGNPSIRWFLHNDPKSVLYIQVLSKGYSKSNIRPLVQFAERTSGGPPSYIRTIDNSVYPPDLAYVYLLRISVWLLFPKGSKCV
jgi:hypothetical protein